MGIVITIMIISAIVVMQNKRKKIDKNKVEKPASINILINIKTSINYGIYANSSKISYSKQIFDEFVAFDTETTGLDPINNKIIEIAAVKYKGGIEVDVFNTLINPGTHITKEITKINGIDDDMVRSSPEIK